MIEFTQFLRPKGRTTRITIERPAAIESHAHALQRIGARFEIEELRTGIISMEVVIPYDGETYSLASELCANGPAVLTSVDKMTLAAQQEAMRLGLITETGD